VWLEKAERAGFTELSVLRRQPMTVERLKRYPLYHEGLLDPLLAQVAPAERDQLVLSALIRAVPGGVPVEGEAGAFCTL
jgi:hypothetical protein